MNIFFTHSTFPAQFRNLAPYLTNNPENSVYFLTESNPANEQLKGVTLIPYKKSDRFNELLNLTKGLWPLKRVVDPIAEGMAVFETLNKLYKEKKLKPDIIVGHAGCGSLLFCKDVYPDVPVIGYFEWYRRIENVRSNYLEAPKRINRVSNRTHHIAKLATLKLCNAGVTPTNFQYLQYPEVYKPKLHVIHDGIDAEFCSPEPNGKRSGLVLDDIQLNLPEGTEIITYIARGLEPVRGFPQFMDAIRIVLANRPNTHVIIVGEDKVFYSVKLKNTTYLKAEEARGGYPADRVHFVGKRGREDYQKILRSSSCHVYLTHPFILSHSCLEAMSFACPIVGSDTAPVQEVIADGISGLLANFHSPHHIARKIEEILDDSDLAKKLSVAARETILEQYEMTKCVRAWEDLIYSLFR